MKMFFKPKSVFKEEREIAAKYFDVVNCRTALKGHDSDYPVIGKYCVSSDYYEYCQDLSNLGLKPINNSTQSHWASRLSHWQPDLEKYTAKTWFNPFENTIVRRVLEKHNGPFFVRYDTKSKRELWKTHCYAADFKSLIEMAPRLVEDYKYENEIICVREFLNLKTYKLSNKEDDTNIHKSFSGQPIVKEFRIHRLLGHEICRHFYWEPFQEEIEKNHGPIHCYDIPNEWLSEITKIADQNSNFYVLDVAQLESGKWTLIELNEGQHAGVHTDFLDVYYKRLQLILTENYEQVK